MANYVDKRELLTEIKISKEQNELTSRAVEMLLRMVKEGSRVFRYKNLMDKEDCMGRAFEDCWRYWRSFNPDHPKANVFSYFTQIIKFGAAKGMNELHPEIKANIDLVPISESDGIYNI